MDEGLTELGRASVGPNRNLETFPNGRPGRYYRITLRTEEFTCVCPVTGQPDFASIAIDYVPDAKVVESKSLKLYFWSYRDQGIFHEDAVNAILDDLNSALEPHWIRVTGAFRPRGGIGIEVEAEHLKTPEARPVRWS
jgi:7-cyano-7-deazaguanine reductase